MAVVIRSGFLHGSCRTTAIRHAWVCLGMLPCACIARHDRPAHRLDDAPETVHRRWGDGRPMHAMNTVRVPCDGKAHRRTRGQHGPVALKAAAWVARPAVSGLT